MEGLRGLKIDDLGLKKPKRAVDNFFERYTGKDAGHHRDHFFRHEQQKRSDLCIAVLVTPSFYNKVFRGQASFDATRSFGQAVEEAEISACRNIDMLNFLPPQQLVQDPDVLEACRKLPPALNKIRKVVYLSPWQKEALRKQGCDPKIILGEMAQKLHLKCRELQCGTAISDGRNW